MILLHARSALYEAGSMLIISSSGNGSSYIYAKGSNVRLISPRRQDSR